MEKRFRVFCRYAELPADMYKKICAFKQSLAPTIDGRGLVKVKCSQIDPDPITRQIKESLLVLYDSREVLATLSFRRDGDDVQIENFVAKKGGGNGSLAIAYFFREVPLKECSATVSLFPIDKKAHDWYINVGFSSDGYDDQFLSACEIGREKMREFADRRIGAEHGNKKKRQRTE